MPSEGGRSFASSRGQFLLAIATTAGAAVVVVARVAFLAHRRRNNPADLEIAKTPLALMGAAVCLAEVDSLEAAQRFMKTHGPARAVAQSCADERSLGLAVFPGSFNPPSHVHVEIVRRVCALPDIDAVWMDMTLHRSCKLYVDVVREDRLRMAEAAVNHLSKAGATQLQAQMGERGWGIEYFETVRELAGVSCGGQPPPRISWVIGSDVLEGMKWWADKAAKILRSCDQVIVFSRLHTSDEVVKCLEKICGETRDSLEAAGLSIVILRFDDGSLEHVSSSLIRRYLVSLLKLVPLSVLQYIVAHRHLVEFYTSLYDELDVTASINEAQPAMRSLKSSFDVLNDTRDTRQVHRQSSV